MAIINCLSAFMAEHFKLNIHLLSWFELLVLLFVYLFEAVCNKNSSDPIKQSKVRSQWIASSTRRKTDEFGSGVSDTILVVIYKRDMKLQIPHNSQLILPAFCAYLSLFLCFVSLMALLFTLTETLRNSMSFRFMKVS